MSIKSGISPACFFRPVAFCFFLAIFGILRNNLRRAPSCAWGGEGTERVGEETGACGYISVLNLIFIDN